MREKAFDKDYSDQYDLLYTDKDYDAECDIIESAFHKYMSSPVRTILDLGCGTGNHAFPLSRRGYRIHGVDISQHMLSCALEKADSIELPEDHIPPMFVQGDVRDINIGQKFDAVLMMFAVLGYQTSNADVMSALRTVRTHLNLGGLFVCDVWYGPAVLTIRPSERVKVMPTINGKVIRATSGTLDTFRHLCEVRYHLWSVSGNQVTNETEETHTVRYFFPQELKMLFESAGLDLLSITRFGDLEKVADEDSWNAIVIGKAVE